MTTRLMISLLALSMPAAAAQPATETICHVPPGSSGSAHTLVVSAAALPAHLGHGDRVGPCPSACQPNDGGCASDADCCSGYCGAGTCATPCAANGAACAGDGACCSGHCESGTCATPCASNGGACTGDGDCCSGLCNSGVCVPPCTVDGEACGGGAACCSGICDGGVCQPPCTADGNSCGTGSDCCSGICTDTSKTCASQCTVGPEFEGPDCTTELDCCEGEGLCIAGACYPEDGSFTCSDIGEACDPDAYPVGQFCCFSAGCVCADDACTSRVCSNTPPSFELASSEAAVCADPSAN